MVHNFFPFFFFFFFLKGRERERKKERKKIIEKEKEKDREKDRESERKKNQNRIDKSIQLKKGNQDPRISLERIDFRDRKEKKERKRTTEKHTKKEIEKVRGGCWFGMAGKLEQNNFLRMTFLFCFWIYF